MQAVILAAGSGTRMGELTKTTPKPLLRILDTTLLERNLSNLPDGISEIVIVVGYRSEQIQSAIGESFRGKKVRYVRQKELKGTGHALALCKGVLQGRFLVLMGDDLYAKGDLQAMISFPLSMLVWKLKADEESGSRHALVVIDVSGRLVDIIERQPAKRGGLVNCGAYVLDEKYFRLPLVAAGNQTSEFGLPQTMLHLVCQGADIHIVEASFWHKVTSPEDLYPY